MRVRLRGINHATKRLANGAIKHYWYAWRGGPLLRGEPGTPEFIASYNVAVTCKITPPEGVLLSVLARFEATEEFRLLAPRTKSDYKNIIDRQIAVEFGDFPLAALTDRKARGVFKDWRDRLALKSRRQADYAWVVLARIFSVALDRGWIDANPCAKGGRLYHGSRRDKIWSEEQEAAFLASAPEHLRLALILALWTGQRQGDLLRLPWSAWDPTPTTDSPEGWIKLRQSKPGSSVAIPMSGPLKAALDGTSRRSPIILLSTHHQPWTEDGFRSSWAKACRRAGIVGLTFHDLRGTAVTRLAVVGCTEAEIATITGLSLAGVREILDAHYLYRDRTLASSAIKKLEKGTNFSNRPQTGSNFGDLEKNKQ